MKNATAIFALFLSIHCNALRAETLVINQDPGTVGESVSFIATGQLDLAPEDSVAEFVVDFSPEFLSNPLGDIRAYSSFRTVTWGDNQDTAGLTITEYVSDGLDQVVPIADFEPITMSDTGYTAGDVPFPAPFPFPLRQFGVRIEGLQGGPIVSFEKNAQTLGRGGGIVLPEPSGAYLAVIGLLALSYFRVRRRVLQST